MCKKVTDEVVDISWKLQKAHQAFYVIYIYILYYIILYYIILQIILYYID